MTILSIAAACGILFAWSIMAIVIAFGAMMVFDRPAKIDALIDWSAAAAIVFGSGAITLGLIGILIDKFG